MAKNETYEEFVDKFKPKKTTDDCYTPPAVYDCVLRHVDENIMPLAEHRVLRPFYPGGDFEHFDYQPGDVVVDNPPFSILARIIDFYIEKNIPFFLFAPNLTLFNYLNRPSVTAIVANSSITFENGAVVKISFLTNMIHSHPAFILDADLCRKLLETNKQPNKQKRKIAYPDCIVTAALLGKIVSRGISWTVPRESVHHIRKMDCGQALFGAGLLLSERVTAERVAAERYELSDRELAIQRSLL